MRWWRSHSEELAPYCLHTLFYCAAISLLFEDRQARNLICDTGPLTVFPWRFGLTPSLIGVTLK